MPDRDFPSLGPGPFDAYKPSEIAAQVENVGVFKARLPILQALALGVLAGAFIALGAMFYTLVITGSELGFGPTRLLGGIAFSLGLILVVVGGAELFTGNNLIVMAWAARRIGHRELLRSWVLVYLGNFAGALGTVALIYLAGYLGLGEGAVGQTAARIAAAKVTIDPVEAFFRGVLCNVLVCLAIWLCFAAHTVPGKILAIIFPISAFVALGFEHSVANMYLIPIGMLAAAEQGAALAPEALAALDLGGFAANLVPVTLGNIAGGGGLVALVYHVIYLRPTRG